MGAWELYEEQHRITGFDKRDAVKRREIRYLATKERNSLSFHHIIVDGIHRDATIINSDNFNEKTLISLPMETFKCGAIVEWEKNHWLITEKDANDELHTKCKMLQCNYLLRWVDNDDMIREQWCIVEDGTKYLTGELENRDFVMTRGDSRVAITLPRTIHTARLGRTNRFIIDDPMSDNKLTYILSKPLKVGHTYNNEGVFGFVLQEVVPTQDDNFLLGIADYFKHFPKDYTVDVKTGDIDNTETYDENTGKKVWL